MTDQKIAIYAGSFDPFTNGHLDILKQATELFDLVYIVFACNHIKKRRYELTKMMAAVEKNLEEQQITRCVVLSSDKLVSDLAADVDARYLIRGLRNPNDYNYEESVAKVNKELNPNLNTIYFRSNNNIISSSMVEELSSYGKDVSRYVSPQVLEIIKAERI